MDVGARVIVRNVSVAGRVTWVGKKLGRLLCDVLLDDGRTAVQIPVAMCHQVNPRTPQVPFRPVPIEAHDTIPDMKPLWFDEIRETTGVYNVSFFEGQAEDRYSMVAVDRLISYDFDDEEPTMVRNTGSAKG